MNTRVFIITAKTNIHVGNENGGDFTIIDKAIQRDPLTMLPCINSSSLKGAINEFCTNGPSPMDGETRKRLFGSDKKDKGSKYQKGEALFFDAKLLLLPQQNDITLYDYVTSKEVFEEMNERIQLFEKNFTYPTPKTFGKNKNVTEVKNLSDRCSDDNLPIIAHNKLDNGESVNLWYEQVLPAQTVFYTIIQEPGDELMNALNGKVVQIGADATIGYGYCKFELLQK